MKVVNEYFIDTKKVIKIENDYGISIYLAHAKQDDTIRLRALINTQFSNEYAPLMHLYEHLMFNNVVVGNEILKNITEVSEYAKKYNLYYNAYTGVDGIEIVVDVQRVKPIKKSKYQCEIEWLQHTTNFHLEKGIQLLYGLLFNRAYLTDEIIEKEIDIVRSEMDTTRYDLSDSEIVSSNLIYNNFIDVLGTTKDFDNLGIDKIKKVIKDFDTKLIHKDYVSIIVHCDLEEYDYMEDLVNEYFSFKQNNFEKVINGTKSKYLNNNITFNFNEKKELTTKLPTLVYNCFFEAKLNIDDILEAFAYRVLLYHVICNIDYGIYNFLRETKLVAYCAYMIDNYNIAEQHYYDELIASKSDTIKLPLAFFAPLNDDVDLDSLYDEVLEFINTLEITKERYEMALKSYVNQFANIEYSLVSNEEIIAQENLIKLIKETSDLTIEQITQKLNQIYNINDFKYNKLLEYLEYFKKNVQLFKIKGETDELQ